jgi:hypothetical protein
MRFFQQLPGLLLLGGLLLGGCSKNEPLEPIAVEDIPTEAAEVFKDSDANTQEVLAVAVAYLQKKDYVNSWNAFQDLAALPDLNDSQRRLAARAVSAIGGKMAEAEAAGDRRAAEARQFHRENK